MTKGVFYEPYSIEKNVTLVNILIMNKLLIVCAWQPTPNKSSAISLDISWTHIMALDS